MSATAIPATDAARRTLMQRPHGTRAKYAFERCRCFKCRVANTNYEYERICRKRAGTWQPFASDENVRFTLAHVARLRRLGMGIKQIAAAAKVNRKTIEELLDPRRRRKRLGRGGRRRCIRTALAKRILDVRFRPAARALIPAARTWQRLEALRQAGWSKARIAKALGYKVPALQLNRDRVTARNARRVAALADGYWAMRIGEAMETA